MKVPVKSRAEVGLWLERNTLRFREGLRASGFDIPEGVHPIVPIMLGEASQASRMAALMLEQGVYVIGFSYPVVPEGKARIRVQISAAHSNDDIDTAVVAFAEVSSRM